MAGKERRLSDKALKALVKKPGRYPDGNSLYFQVTAKLNCSWIFRYRLRGRTPEMGLGSYPEVMGKEARELRDEARKLVRNGINPIENRKAKRLAEAPSMTVTQAVEGWIEAVKKGWLSRRYESMVRARFMKYAAPHIGHLSIADIKSPDIAQMLYPIWNVLASAEELRQNLEGAINWAIVKGHRSDEKVNPAEWKRLKHLLPIANRAKQQREERHFPALPYAEVPKFLTELRQRKGLRFRALELILLTAVRIGDVCSGGKVYSTAMMWKHVDLEAAVWKIPDTKAGHPITVPLSTQAVSLLNNLPSRVLDGFVFPSNQSSRTGAISSRTINDIFPLMGYAGRACPHGFRSAFKTFCEEELAVDRAVIESALAHSQGALEAAYHRGDHLQKRRALMQQWADYLDGREAKVIQLPKRS